MLGARHFLPGQALPVFLRTVPGEERGLDRAWRSVRRCPCAVIRLACGSRASQKDTTGTGIYPTEADCCAPGGAFSDGCDHPLPTTCWIVGDLLELTVSAAAALCAESWAFARRPPP